ncbi:NAD(P)H-dependent oxidoreductase [Polaribacter reichenbachii]|uniref:NAD(P)H-dependent oxidoreductase n=1 Tax=Polaribacter reichenbachii TaxID=996801 RepID=A0A1B8U5L1_9FLAO|nr:NAD(P)H-dependent oxidoreductase [Polaribacter reichenbachii]APZ46614.1 NAD(P)H-dependent oxidoreductase [Polaribacter reichenbachii]AUC17259.1 NAD(P)H-dependent oxidoreductase [Polaribacter reichenbachii]OBY67143.1 NAD(P)H-dependent oxidoreductase [Polaribacter reichenbachii]
MNTIESLQWRYAVKKFDKNKTLSAQQIETLKEAFNLTPTSYGLQPIKLAVIQNKAIQEELVLHSMNQPQVLEASHLLVICIPKIYDNMEVENYFDLVQEVRQTPDEIINPFKEFLTNQLANKTQEELTIWNKNQAYIALGNLLTVCAIEKIDACPMEGFIPEKYDEVLKLNKQNLTSVLVIPVGFRAEDDYMKDLKKVRKNIDDSIIDIK